MELSSSGGPSSPSSSSAQGKRPGSVPVLSSSGVALDPRTHEPLPSRSRLDYASLAQSPQEKFEAKVLAAHRADEVKQRAVDQHWAKEKKEKGGQVDSVSMHVLSSSSTLQGVVDVRRESLAASGVIGLTNPIHHRRSGSLVHAQSPERPKSREGARSISRERHRDGESPEEKAMTDLGVLRVASLPLSPSTEKLEALRNKRASFHAGERMEEAQRVGSAAAERIQPRSSSPSALPPSSHSRQPSRSSPDLPPLPLPLPSSSPFPRLGVEPVSQRSEWTEADPDFDHATASDGLSTGRSDASLISAGNSSRSSAVPLSASHRASNADSASLDSSSLHATQSGSSSSRPRPWHRPSLSLQLEGDERGQLRSQHEQQRIHTPVAIQTNTDSGIDGDEKEKESKDERRDNEHEENSTSRSSKRSSGVLSFSIPTAAVTGAAQAELSPTNDELPVTAAAADDGEPLQVWRTDARPLPGDDSSGVSSDSEDEQAAAREHEQDATDSHSRLPAQSSLTVPAHDGFSSSPSSSSSSLTGPFTVLSPPLSPDPTSSSDAFSSMLDAVHSGEGGQQTSTSMVSLACTAPVDHSRSSGAASSASSAPAAHNDGPSSLEYTLVSLRSRLSHLRSEVSSLRSERDYQLRELQVTQAQRMNVKELAAKREQEEQTKMLGRTLQQTLAQEGSEGDVGSSPPLLLPASAYSAEDHQLNLLYLRQLLYGSLKEEKDLQFLSAALTTEQQQLEERYSRTYDHLTRLVGRTHALRDQHARVIGAEQLRMVGLLSKGEANSSEQAVMLDSLRSLTRFFSQLHGFEREPPAPNANGGQQQQMGHPLLPACSRCQRSLLPTDQDEQLRQRMVQQKRARIQAHAASTSLDAVVSPASPAPVNSTVLRPSSAFPLTNPHHSAGPRASASSSSLLSSTSSVRAQQRDVRSAKRTEWDMLQQLEGMAKETIKQKKAPNRPASGTGKAKEATVATLGIIEQSRQRELAVCERSNSTFIGGSTLRPSSAVVHPSSRFPQGQAFSQSPSPSLPPSLGPAGHLTARLLQSNLFARQSLHSLCPAFVHLATGRLTCRDCKYALEANPYAKHDSGMWGGAEWNDGSTLPATFFAPDQASVRFFRHRKLVPMEEVRPDLLPSSSNAGSRPSSAKQQASPSSRPFSALTSRDLGAQQQNSQRGGQLHASESASSLPPDSHRSSLLPRPQQQQQQQRQSSTSSPLKQDLKRGLQPTVQEDTLSILRRLRGLLGFHTQRHVQENKAILLLKQQQQRASPASPSPLDKQRIFSSTAPVPLLQSGAVAWPAALKG